MKCFSELKKVRCLKFTNNIKGISKHRKVEVRDESIRSPYFLLERSLFLGFFVLEDPPFFLDFPRPFDFLLSTEASRVALFRFPFPPFALLVVFLGVFFFLSKAPPIWLF